MNSSPKVAIVSLNWNGKNHLELFLPSVEKQTYSNFFSIIVDNGSIDSSIDFLNQFYPSIHVISHSDNLGYAKGFNSGIKYAIEQGAEYILITNNDVILDKEILTHGINLFNLNKDIGYMAGKIYDIKNPNTFQYAGGRIFNSSTSMPSRGANEIDVGQYEVVEDFDFMDDVCSLVSVNMIKDIGPYDEDFFFDYEETEWNCRMQEKGYRITYNPKMKVWHRMHGSTGGIRLSSFTEFYTWRGKVLFLFKTQGANVFLRSIINLVFLLLPIRFILLFTKYKNPILFYFTFKGVISSFKRVIEIKGSSR